MTENKSKLNGFEKIKGLKVVLGDDSKVVIKEKGTVKKENIEICNISYVEGLKYNLMNKDPMYVIILKIIYY